jgi:CRISPR/Cas system CSM-associated protein Csm4 (group 5 of RAMP superfamily)
MINIDGIKESIKKQLPSLVADELKDYIDEAEKNKNKLKEAEKTIIQKNKDIDNLLDLNKTHKSNEDKTNTILARETSLKEGEQKLELEKLKFEITKQMLELRATEAEKRAMDVVGYTATLVRHPITQDFFSINKSTNSYGPTGSTNHNENYSESRTIRQSKDII